MSDERSGTDEETSEEPEKGKINDPLTQGETDAPQQSWGSEDAG